MNPETRRSKWITIDGYYADALKHRRQLQWDPNGQRGAALEMSRRGVHLWILADRPLPARERRLDYERFLQRNL